MVLVSGALLLPELDWDQILNHRSTTLKILYCFSPGLGAEDSHDSADRQALACSLSGAHNPKQVIYKYDTGINGEAPQNTRSEVQVSQPQLPCTGVEFRHLCGLNG